MDVEISAPHKPEQMDATALVYNTLRSTWSDYCTWEQDDCLQALRSLSIRDAGTRLQMQDTASNIPRSRPRRNHPLRESSKRKGKALRSKEMRQAALAGRIVFPLVPSLTSTSFFTVEEFESPSPSSSFQPSSSYTLPAPPSTFTYPSPPYPSYESCTPTNRNIMVGDDSHYMPFLPFSDDPTFEHESHTELYNYFSWQVPFRDPDLEVVVVETVRRLTSSDLQEGEERPREAMSLLDIDETNVLPLQIYSSSDDQVGLLTTTRRRDFPKWPATGPFGTCPLPYLPAHATATPSSNLSNLLRYFCNNLDCTIGYCSVHMGEISLPIPTPPALTSEALFTATDKACGPACCLLGSVSARVATYWSSQDIDILRSILNYCPDTSPCDLAVICRKPCNEVLKQRQRLFADISQPKGRKGTKRPAHNSLVFNDHDASCFTPNRPCGHPGPCDSRADCPCFQNKAHCQNACRCGPKCVRRNNGCRCAKTTKERTPCGTKVCPCFKAHRECNPEVCLKCCAKFGIPDPAANLCLNTPLQQGRCKRTQVRQSQWGLGLFLMEDAEKDDFIAEYVGELIYEPTTLSRDDVSQHRGRTYLFQLNPLLSIDGTPAANETRYINHSKEPNCQANVRLVNGEHRIGIYTLKRMKPGTEILFDYGNSFFEPNIQSAPQLPTSTNAASTSEEFDIDPSKAIVQDAHSSDETYREDDGDVESD